MDLRSAVLFRNFRPMEAQSQLLGEIAKRLREAMSRVGLRAENEARITTAEIARRLEGQVSEDAINKWLRGIQEPKICSLALVARELQVSLDWLVFGDDVYLVDQEAMEEVDRLQAISDDRERKNAITQKLDDAPELLRVAVETIRKVKVSSRDERIVAETKVRDLLSSSVGDLVEAWQKLLAQWREALATAMKERA